MTLSRITTVRLHVPTPSPAPNIARLAQKRLQESSYSELRNIDCDFAEGVLILRGRVSSFHMKQVAQVIAARVDEVESLINQLEVMDTSALAADNHGGNSDSAPTATPR
jgi:osmotically-inducible protein OsmY